MGRSAAQRSTILAVLVSAASWAAPAAAQQRDTARAARQQPAQPGLAQQATNPIADLVSLTFQYNLQPDLDHSGRTLHSLNFQPGLPFGLGAWNLITRPVLPFVSQPLAGPPGTPGRKSGLGDAQLSAMLTPAAPTDLMWALGATLAFPTASDEVLGQKAWQAGPAAVLLHHPTPRWMLGFFFQQWWSYAEVGERPDVSQMSLQYIVNHYLPRGWIIASSPIVTANWEAQAGERWTVPVGGGVGKVFQVGSHGFNANLQLFYTLVRPETLPAPRWILRASLAPLLPAR